MKKFFALAAFGWLGTSLELASAAQEEVPVGYELNIDRVEVDVLVTDEDGNFVEGLTPDDFEVYEEGKRVKIEDFEMRSLLPEPPPGASEAPSPGPDALAVEPRKFILFLDMLNATGSRIQSMKPHLLHFVEDVLGPRDEVMVAILTADRRVLILQTFTRSRARLREAISVLRGSPSNSLKTSRQENDLALLLDSATREGGGLGGSADMATFQTRIEMATDLVRSYAAEEYQRAVFSLSALASVVERVDNAGWNTGRKSVIYVSEGISLRPGQPLMDFLNKKIELFNSMMAFGDSTRGGGSAFRLYPVTTDEDLTSFLRKTTGRLNRVGATLYTIDARGLFRSAGEDPSRPRSDMSLAEQQMSFFENQQSLNALASDTGGMAYLNTTNYAKVLGQIERDNRQRYFFTYNPPKHKKTKEPQIYEIKVKCKKSRVSVRARNSYLDI